MPSVRLTDPKAINRFTRFSITDFGSEDFGTQQGKNKTEQWIDHSKPLQEMELPGTIQNPKSKVQNLEAQCKLPRFAAQLSVLTKIQA